MDIPLTAHYMVNAASSGDLNVVKKIVESGIHPDDYKNNSMPAIVAATCRGKYSIVEYLLSQGANPNNYTNDKVSALKSAALYKHSDIIKLLIQHNADPNYERNGDVALTIAIDQAEEKDLELIKFLFPITDKQYYQKCYEYASNETIRKFIVDSCPDIQFVDPKEGFGGPNYKKEVKYNTPPTCKIRRQIWDLISLCSLFECDPNKLVGPIMYKMDIAGSTEETTIEELKDIITDRHNWLGWSFHRLYNILREKDGETNIFNTKFPEIYQMIKETQEIWDLNDSDNDNDNNE